METELPDGFGNQALPDDFYDKFHNIDGPDEHAVQDAEKRLNFWTAFIFGFLTAMIIVLSWVLFS